MEEDKIISFLDLKLAKPIIRALNENNFTNPTKVQAETIPKILSGQDICATAITGSGKSMAFLIPIVQKLLTFRGLPGPKALIMSPTRELAQQLKAVCDMLAAHCAITSTLVIGGVSDEEQRELLTPAPDIIIGTPGRFIDSIFNAKVLKLEHLQFFVLDEADRLLGKGFESQLNTIVSQLPEKHQTLLFTATLNDQVAKLATKIQKKSSEKISINPYMELNPNITQMFIKTKKEERRLPYLVALCRNMCKDKTLVFFPTKALAHHVFLLFKNLGIASAELHADLSQTARNEAIEQFRESKVQYLLASDLAARGIDIPDIEYVINFTIPNELERYIHRTGRTGRAGKKGTAISMYVTPEEKRVMKKMQKNSPGEVQFMTIPDNLRDQALESVKQYEEQIEEEKRKEEEEKEKRAEIAAEKRMKAMLDIEEEVPQKMPGEDAFKRHKKNRK
ncbi:DEAD/DEAH box helicase family protein [Trichomonas vaginalis G3]|uniref:DEAD/DEAH box helicase family protein n=1 Tax=Trichomonas vaginalis (strain ATCC PRA-98 / G3) TaxID=412133 RepID=A2DB16_TRIV3|nr:helicase protein [Trichomonas vaginalis G3]EAY22346.1 DEAD/DEAH box helicase family protein [Trichomonas vaginalis G3]KAI5518284.1 helicase protein [Trichomonas vaginalis G3]|eukprot:XP_001583332.1 DEAD/DEAH box helicase family protein [Trichomonas vaginalis G3]